MSSNGARNSGIITSKGTYDGDFKKEFLEFQTFGKFMNLFLTRNLHEWKRTRHEYPMYNLRVCREPNEQMLQLQKSILVLAYLFRRKLWKVFRSNFKHPRLDGDKTYKLFRSIPERHYMYHYLVHLACLYEKTMFDYSTNYNVTARVVVDITQCIQERFLQEGAFKKLYIAADKIHVFYDTLVFPLGKKFPDTDILTPFTRAVNIIERRRRYKEWNDCLKAEMNPEDDPKHKHKLQTLIDIKADEYRLGYVAVNKNPSQYKDSPSNISSQTMHTPIVGDSPSSTLDKTDLKGNNDFLPPSTSSDEHIDATQNEATNTEGGLVIHYDTLLVVSENFCKKYMSSKESKLELNCERNIKIYCPKKITEVAILSMKTLVDDIHECKSYELPYGFHGFVIDCFGKFDNHEIILDTSSEEEDGLETYQESIRNKAIEDFQELKSFRMRVMKYLLGEYTKKENLFEFLYTEEENSEGSTGAIPKARTPIQMKPGSSANGTGAIPKAKTPIQRKPGSSARGTGAIPKVKTSIQPKPGSNVRVTGAILKVKTFIQTKPRSSARVTGVTPNAPVSPVQSNDRVPPIQRSPIQNAPTASHSSNSSSETKDRKISRSTRDGKREWRKKPSKWT